MSLRHGVALGVDLGTSNTVVGFVLPGETLPRVLSIPQRVAAHTEEARELLPSTLYAPIAGEVAGDPGFFPGAFAKARAGEVPSRGVPSHKSWLGHAAADRRAAILPFGISEDLAGPRISPCDAAHRVLEHVHHAWMAAHPERPLGEAIVALTVPASFDDDARELTRIAAERAGLGPSLRLLEEPVAALYDYLSRDDAEATLAGLPEGSLVLVCDVGGGTTDLSLVRIEHHEGRPTLTRVASGRHLLLGGDNMDLALAHAIEDRFVQAGDKLSPARFGELAASCRAAKERLFSTDAVEANVTLLGQGSKLVGGSRTATLPRALAEEIVSAGFFPVVARGEAPRGPTTALRGLGLPYERDPAVTRHVAAFLARHASEGHVRAIFLNGGVFRADRLRRALTVGLAACFETEPVLLPNPDPDLAVARGAAIYARLLARGDGAKIRGGSARSYFVGVGDGGGGAAKAVCVVPRFAEESATFETTTPFLLTLGTRARFSLFASDVDKSEAGTVVALDDTRFFPLPDLVAKLGEPGEVGRAKVVVRGEVTAVGTLDLQCVNEHGRAFRLSFRLDPRDEGTPSLPPASILSPAPVSLGSNRPTRAHSSPARDRALELVTAVFGKKADEGARATKDLPRELEKVLGEKGTWPVDTARAIADVLLANPGSRKRSADHERVWFQLVGHGLRPGRGFEGDAARVASFEKTWDGKLGFPDEPRGFAAFFVAFRRVAPGLSRRVQESIGDYAASVLAPNEANPKRPKRMPDAQDELVHLAASLERVPLRLRGLFGEWLFDRVRAKDDPRLWDALGKIGARVPSYGSLHEVLPVSQIEPWLERLVRSEWKKDTRALSRAACLLARATGDRTRDVSDRVRKATLAKLEAARAVPDEPWLRMVREVVLPEDALAEVGLFDDDLPPGLTLVRDAGGEGE